MSRLEQLNIQLKIAEEKGDDVKWNTIAWEIAEEETNNYIVESIIKGG